MCQYTQGYQINFMIAYEIQLRYVIPDKIQSETKFSPTKICQNKLSEKNGLRHCLGFPVRNVSCLGQIDAYHH